MSSEKFIVKFTVTVLCKARLVILAMKMSKGSTAIAGLSLYLRTFVHGLQARRNEIHIGGAERSSERSEEKWGSGGLPPGKFFMTTPLRSLENAPFLENVLLTEAKDHD